MNKKLILIALSAVMFSTVSCAQKVIKSDSAVIIDCSDMNPKFYSSKKIEPRTTTATNETDPTNGAADISSPESNAKVYKKFEVHRTDNSEETDWKSAVTLCATLTTDNGGWRLPTQRELMLMLILKEKLEANGITPFSPNYYWTATQNDANGAWLVNLSSGEMNGTYKINDFSVRCVRDL